MSSRRDGTGQAASHDHREIRNPIGNQSLKLGKYVKLPSQRSNADLLVTVAHLAGVDTIRDASGAIVPFDTFGSTAFFKGPIAEIFS
jgi:hypothetical protein